MPQPNPNRIIYVKWNDCVVRIPRHSYRQLRSYKAIVVMNKLNIPKEIFREIFFARLGLVRSRQHPSLSQQLKNV